MTPSSPLASLPPMLLGGADVAGSGELLWPASDAFAVLAWIVEQRLGIIGIEAYGRVEQAGALLCAEWPTEPRWQAGEPWPRYVARAAASAREAIDRHSRQPAGSCDDSVGDRRYFIAVCTRDEYPRQARD